MRSPSAALALLLVTAVADPVAAAASGSTFHNPRLRAGDLRAQDAPPAPARPVPGVAVVPFTNITRDGSDSWIGTGIAETVIADLQAQAPVSAIRSDAIAGERRRLKDAGQDVEDAAVALELARGLGARWLVAGGYQRVGDRLRITARIVDVSTGAIADTVKIDGALDELFALQDRIAAGLAPKLGLVRQATVSSATTPRRAEIPAERAVTPSAVGRPPVSAPTSASAHDVAEVAVAAPRAGLTGGVGGVMDGPPPPVPPEVVARDERGRVTVRAVRITQGLQVDGRLDERVYASVRAITGFIQNVPDVGQPVSQKTEAWIFFDDDNLYVSARCWDTAPESEWVANEMRRDGTIVNNDNFGVTLDTFYDRRNAFMFYTNPLGGMVDTEITNEGNANRDWNTVWTVRTSRFDGGWTVEMQIPFKSLRYRPGAAQIWGVQLRRGIRRRNEWAFLTALPPTSASGAWMRISMAAALVGLEVPPGSKNLEIKPYGISGLSTDRTASPVVSNKVDGELGLDVKYGLTQNLTLDFTYNTDFAQVEVDEQQINLTRFNLFFPEKREFFLEGRGLFEFARRNALGGAGLAGGSGGNVPQLLFSRQIGLNRGRVVPIIGGARVTGKVGRLRIGALNIQTDEEPVSGTEATNFTVLRLKQDLLRRSSVGVLFTGRSRSTRARGESNEAYGVDASLSFYENVNFNGYYARTETPGLAGNDESYQASFDYGGDRYGVQVDHLFVGDAFNPEVGFVRRDDMRRTFVSGRFSPRPRSSRVVRRFVWDASLEYILNTAGELETRQQAFSFDTEFQSSDRINLDAGRTYEWLARPFQIAPGVTIPIGGYGFDSVRASYTFGQQRRLSGSVALEHGSFYDGEQTSVAVNQGRMGITPQLSLEPSASITWIELPYGSLTTRLYRTRLTYTFTPRMFLSALLQYNSSSETIGTNLRLRWEYIPGSELFIVYTEDRERDLPGAQVPELLNRALVVKLNRLFRF